MSKKEDDPAEQKNPYEEILIEPWPLGSVTFNSEVFKMLVSQGIRLSIQPPPDTNVQAVVVAQVRLYGEDVADPKKVCVLVSFEKISIREPYVAMAFKKVFGDRVISCRGRFQHTSKSKEGIPKDHFVVVMDLESPVRNPRTFARKLAEDFKAALLEKLFKYPPHEIH